MKQHEFIWVMKQYPTDKTYMMDNGQTVVLIKDLTAQRISPPVHW